MITGVSIFLWNVRVPMPRKNNDQLLAAYWIDSLLSGTRGRIVREFPGSQFMRGQSSGNPRPVVFCKGANLFDRALYELHLSYKGSFRSLNAKHCIIAQHRIVKK